MVEEVDQGPLCLSNFCGCLGTDHTFYPHVYTHYLNNQSDVPPGQSINHSTWLCRNLDFMSSF